MEDFSEITDLETARRVLIGYDKAFREHAEIHTEMEAEIERLREALKKIVERDWQFNKDGKLGKIYGPCAVIARAALKGDE